MEFNTFEAVKIGLASPEKIRAWSYGEVTKPETINYRTLKPEKDGLFCEKIFGPTKDWECHCGKYKRIKFKGKICEKCGVEVTKAKVRRERMGHIELAAPVSHIWYFKGIPARMGLMLDISPKDLEKVLYFDSYIVVDPGSTPLLKKQILNDTEYAQYAERYEDDFKAMMGAEAIKLLLQEIDLDQLAAELKEELESATGQKKSRLVKRVDVVEAFRLSGNRPEWMILDVIPVIPPEIRPMVQLDGGRFATSDLNDLYRRVINRNNRLKRLLELGAPEVIIRNEKRILQQAVDALIDNGRRGRPVTGQNNRPLKSLSDMLKGKQGRFRQNLLGKRVDYSGRSVIVVGPELKIYQCGLPKEMAIELFKPFVMKKLVNEGQATNVKSAKKMVERMRKEVWDALESVIKDHPVLLNRAPTLHRLGIQAFEPVLVEGRALKLHPLVCTAFNADFDGDQMAVHVPLSAEAQAEARMLMLSANNLLKPQDGHPVTVPTQDMVLGSYYLTIVKHDEPGEGKAFRDEDEAIVAYDNGVIGLHSPIRVRRTGMWNGREERRLISCTVGQLIFNHAIPQDLGFVDRSNPEKIFDLEIQEVVTKSILDKIIYRCIKEKGSTVTAEMLDMIKAQGFKFSTRGSITVSCSDMTVPPKKYELIEEAEKKITKIINSYRRGLISEDERYQLVISTWDETTKLVTDELKNYLDEFNPIYMMANSGARGSMNQIRQLAGMRGLMANTSGKAIEIPIRANFREGLNVLEYFISSRGARKGMADTALRTADSGYLTRRLVDVAQDVIIREKDCGTTEGIFVSKIVEGDTVIEKLRDRLVGRHLVHDLVDEKTGEVLVPCDRLMSDADVDLIEARGIERIEIRSALTCRSHHGVCARCYGANLANGQPVSAGEAVGIISAQSIGEPGTQLTMRTFHTGGVASGEDITQGLPRVEELFEARRPKKAAVLAEETGVINRDYSERDAKDNCTPVVITTDEGEEKRINIPFGLKFRENLEGTRVEKGQIITDGVVNPHDVLRLKGDIAAQDYLIKEVQNVYRLQGVDINDKHVEVIVRQMIRKVRIEANPQPDMLIGTLIDRYDVEDRNRELQARIDAGEEGIQLVVASPVLLGITKASLATDSFLSAASFQETTKVLTDAAIRGKVDPLVGLKENVIIGRLVPAGTGMEQYRNLEIESTVLPEDSEEDLEV